MRLRVASSPAWLNTVVSNFDAFLLDHAACERKASATALTFVTHYADRPELALAMIELAQEELSHFQQIYTLLVRRGTPPQPDVKDPYIKELQKHLRQGREAYFLDRLLIAGIVEARGCERFGLIAEALPEGELKELYREITRSEARHHGLFVRFAKKYFDGSEVELRLDELLDIEAAILPTLELRPALH